MNMTFGRSPEIVYDITHHIILICTYIRMYVRY